MSKLKKYNKIKLLLAVFVFVIGLVCGKKVINLFNKKVRNRYYKSKFTEFMQ